jgi:hypothetical protein
MERHSAIHSNKKLLIAWLIFISPVYSGGFNSFKLLIKEQLSALLSFKMLLAKNTMVQAKSGESLNKNTSVYNWILFGFLSLYSMKKWVFRKARINLIILHPANTLFFINYSQNESRYCAFQISMFHAF